MEETPKSIKDIETFNYKGIPVVIYDDPSGVAVYYWAAEEKEGIVQYVEEYLNLPPVGEYQQTIKSLIDSKIERGHILDLGEGEPDYESLDDLFFDKALKVNSAIYAGANSNTATTMKASQPQNTRFSLDTAADIQAAINDAKQVGGRKQYVLGMRLRKGWLVLIQWDYSKGKYRAYVNDGIHSWGPASFPNSARTGATVYVVTELSHTGRNYYIPPSTDLTFTTTLATFI